MWTAARTSSSRWPGSAAVAPPRPGPSWLDTRPLGLVGPSSDPRLLVAAGLDWFPYVGGPSVPSPAAAGRARSVADRFVGAVRARRSRPDRDHVGIERPRRAAAHRPDRVPGRARRLRWPPGTRLLVRAAPITETIPASHSSLLTNLPRSSTTDVPGRRIRRADRARRVWAPSAAAACRRPRRATTSIECGHTRGHPRRQLDRHRRRG